MKDKFPIILFCIVGMLITAAGLYFSGARKMILGVIFLSVGAVMMESAKENRPRREQFFMGLAIAPTVFAGLFYKIPGDLVLIYFALMFAGLMAFSLFSVIRQRYIDVGCIVIFVIALASAFFMNREALGFIH